MAFRLGQQLAGRCIEDGHCSRERGSGEHSSTGSEAQVGRMISELA
jgi:hypothetical protein